MVQLGSASFTNGQVIGRGKLLTVWSLSYLGTPATWLGVQVEVCKHTVAAALSPNTKGC